MSIYKPTWLYIKQHNQTGLKYFGKTTKDDPIKYLGSGKRWVNHLKVHGNDVSTVWCQLFENKEELTLYALTFSAKNDIVKSKDWANLKPEDGLWGGGIPGHKQTPEHVESRAKHVRGRKHSAEEREKMVVARNKRAPRSAESKAKTSKSLLGQKRTEQVKQKMRKPKSETAKSNMVKSWTPERRLAQSLRAKAMNEARLSAR